MAPILHGGKGRLLRAGTFPAWWTVGGAPDPLFAHRAISTPGSPYGPGPANQAASYIDLVTPGTNNLTPGVAPGWNALTGWAGPGADLHTGYTPGDGDVYLVRYAGGTLGGGGWPAGAARTSGATVVFGAAPCEAGGCQYYYGNGNYFALPGLIAGVVGMKGAQGYRAGAPDGGPGLGAWVDTCIEFYLMAVNIDGVAGGQWAGTVQADVLWQAASAPTNAQILAVSVAMMAL